jgi:hypothetical protein
MVPRRNSGETPDDPKTGLNPPDIWCGGFYLKAFAGIENKKLPVMKRLLCCFASTPCRRTRQA